MHRSIVSNLEWDHGVANSTCPHDSNRLPSRGGSFHFTRPLLVFHVSPRTNFTASVTSLCSNIAGCDSICGLAVRPSTNVTPSVDACGVPQFGCIDQKMLSQFRCVHQLTRHQLYRVRSLIRQLFLKHPAVSPILQRLPLSVTASVVSLFTNSVRSFVLSPSHLAPSSPPSCSASTFTTSVISLRTSFAASLRLLCINFTDVLLFFGSYYPVFLL